MFTLSLEGPCPPVECTRALPVGVRERILAGDETLRS